MIRLGVDFGSSGSVIMRIDSATLSSDGAPLYSPNLVHITSDGSRIFGNEVIRKGLIFADSTARHMQHYVLQNSPHMIMAGSYSVSCQQVTKDYLVSLIREAASLGGLHAEELVVSIPADAPPHYSRWIASVAADAGFQNHTVIDEISAAALGYGHSISINHQVMLIDFGADTFKVNIGNIVHDAGTSSASCRIIGSAVIDIGGRSIDRWIAEHLLWETQHTVRYNLSGLEDGSMHEICRCGKEALSFREETTIAIPCNAPEISTEKNVVLTRGEFENLLKNHNLYRKIEETIEKALSTASRRGYNENHLSLVLMVGGGSYIPSVRDVVSRRFNNVKVVFDNPREAVARGAALYSSPAFTPERVSRDYAIRYWDPSTHQHQFRYIVRRGTVYPTERDVSRLLITASYDGQTHLGLALYALGTDEQPGNLKEIELVFDTHGSLLCLDQPVQCSSPTAEWINERNPTLLTATPPAMKGELRFELIFRIDPTGHLIISARDVKSGLNVLENHSMAQLT